MKKKKNKRIIVRVAEQITGLMLKTKRNSFHKSKRKRLKDKESKKEINEFS